MSIKRTEAGTIITGDDINVYRLLTLLSGLRLEVRSGMKLTRGRTCYSRIKEEFGLKGNKQRVLDQFEAYISELKGEK